MFLERVMYRQSVQWGVLLHHQTTPAYISYLKSDTNAAITSIIGEHIKAVGPLPSTANHGPLISYLAIKLLIYCRSKLDENVTIILAKCERTMERSKGGGWPPTKSLQDTNVVEMLSIRIHFVAYFV